MLISAPRRSMVMFGCKKGEEKRGREKRGAERKGAENDEELLFGLA